MEQGLWKNSINIKIIEIFSIIVKNQLLLVSVEINLFKFCIKYWLNNRSPQFKIHNIINVPLSNSFPEIQANKKLS